MSANAGTYIFYIVPKFIKVNKASVTERFQYFIKCADGLCCFCSVTVTIAQFPNLFGGQLGYSLVTAQMNMFQTRMKNKKFTVITFGDINF
jgi:hypothetical protein